MLNLLNIWLIRTLKMFQWFLYSVQVFMAKNELNGVSSEPETRSTWNAKYYDVLETNYSTEISPHFFMMGHNYKCHKKQFLRVSKT